MKQQKIKKNKKHNEKSGKIKNNKKLLQDGKEGVFVVFKVTAGGELLAHAQGDKEPILVIENRRIKPLLGEGDEFVGSLYHYDDLWWVKPKARVKKAFNADETILGIVERRGNKAFLVAADKSVHMEYLLEDGAKLKNNDFVRVGLSGERKFKQARVIKNFGQFSLNKATEALILEKYEIPYIFDEKTEAEIKHLPQMKFAQREDFTNLDLVTVDGEDSKDFDDAIWAEKSAIGYNLAVAIADVSFYVRDGSEIDKEAQRRGNSVYLPNLTIPMLPDKLCNDLCSLMPDKNRAAIVCLMSIDNNGHLLGYDFRRAVIRSKARLTYKMVQEALEGKNHQLDKWVKPLYQAYEVLKKASRKRGALELTTTEINIKVDKNGQVVTIAPKITTEADKIIEEFMIIANNAAALQLKKAKLPIMYRVHDCPPQEKLDGMKGLLDSMGMKMPDRLALKGEHFNRLIEKSAKNGEQTGISELVLRMQAQAQYSSQNIGHFGLGLKDYVHFTSPIRRYADLTIHRALVQTLKFEPVESAEVFKRTDFDELAKHLCETERKAINAERDLVARFVSAYLQPAVGQEFEVNISGLANAGIFVNIASLGAEGLIPLYSLPDDDYVLSEGNLKLSGQYNEREFGFGDVIRARLEEASPITGGLIFKYLDPEEGDAYYSKGGRGKVKIAERKKSVRSKKCAKRIKH